MKTSLVYTVFFLWFSVSTKAQLDPQLVGETKAFSLAEAQTYAVEHSVIAINAQLDKEISKKRSLEIITEGIPKFTGYFGYQNNFELQTNVFPANTFPGQEQPLDFKIGNPYASSAYLEIQQLFVDGRYFLGLKANKTIMTIADEQKTRAAIDIKTQVAKSYYAAAAAKASKEIVEKNIAILTQLLDETKALYQNGFAEELDVDRLQLNLGKLLAAQKENQMQLELSYNVLKYQMGLSPNDKIELKESLNDFTAAEQSEYTVEGFDPKSRVEYRLQDLRAQMRRFDKKRFGLAYMPSIFGSFTYGYNTFGRDPNVFQLNWFPYGTAGINVVIPIFDGFKNGAQYQQKKLEEKQLRNSLKDFENAATLEVGNTNTQYEIAIEQLKTALQNVALAQKIYNKVQIKFKNGLSSTFELSEAETALSEAQAQFINAQLQVLHAKTDLDKALGNIK